MKIAQYPNPITRHARLVRSLLPSGAACHKGRMGPIPATVPRREPPIEYRGLTLVKWLIDNGQKQDALSLLSDIKSRKVSHKTGLKI